MFILQNKDLPEDLNDPDHIEPYHVGCDVEMADEEASGKDLSKGRGIK